MRSRHVMVLAGALVALMSLPLFAHHGSAMFDTGKKVTLKGTVKEWVYVNPHCLLTLDVKGEDGQVVQWLAETQLQRPCSPLAIARTLSSPATRLPSLWSPSKMAGQSDVSFGLCSRMGEN